MHDSAVDGQREDQVGTGPPFNASGSAGGRGGAGAAAVTTGSSWESSLSELAHGEAAGRPVTTRDHVFVDRTSNIPVRTEKGS